jgi:hypothetical protein
VASCEGCGAEKVEIPWRGQAVLINKGIVMRTANKLLKTEIPIILIIELMFYVRWLSFLEQSVAGDVVERCLPPSFSAGSKYMGI